PRIVAVLRTAAAGGEPEAGLVDGFALEEDRAPLARDLIEEIRLRTVARAVPVRRAGNARKYRRALLGRLESRLHFRTAFCIEPLRPCLLHERGAVDELAVGAIEYVVEAVAIGLRDELAHAAVDLRLEEHDVLHGIPVV